MAAGNMFDFDLSVPTEEYFDFSLPVVVDFQKFRSKSVNNFLSLKEFTSSTIDFHYVFPFFLVESKVILCLI